MTKFLRFKLYFCFSISRKSRRHRKTAATNTTDTPMTITATTLIPSYSDSDCPQEFTSTSKSATTTHSGASSSSLADLSLDLARALSSRRFFFSPGRSHSLLLDSCFSTSSFRPAKPLPPPAPAPFEEVVDGGVAILTYSPDPYSDFRTSMQEMVEAQDLDISADWGYLQEMLTCYLKLNSRRTHKYIVGAFADLLMNLMMGRRQSDMSGGYELLR
ncbi:transcription repressor OFP16-like [Nymphaea colorata]|nr:transcription repressor OFP16-like [Nymphaea colorata]